MGVIKKGIGNPLHIGRKIKALFRRVGRSFRNFLPDQFPMICFGIPSIYQIAIEATIS
jgi:hypothetical protein